jgi:hypothetical protein
VQLKGLSDELVIDPDEVEQALRDCLYRPEELGGLDPEAPPPGTVIVEGVMSRYGFHPERLEAKREQVTTWLRALPHQFRRTGGGGWSFLNACNQENGRQWTGLHQRMEQLFCLAIGLGLAKCQVPRELWHEFPGGMPYYVVFVEDEAGQVT